MRSRLLLSCNACGRADDFRLNVPAPGLINAMRAAHRRFAPACRSIDDPPLALHLVGEREQVDACLRRDSTPIAIGPHDSPELRCDGRLHRIPGDEAVIIEECPEARS